MAVSALLTICATAQNSAPVTVNADKTVIITYPDTTAKEVILQGQFITSETVNLPQADLFIKDGKLRMKRDDNGIASYTSNALASDLYWYNFNVDDSTMIDKRNTDVVRDINTYYNYFIVPGGDGDLYTDAKNAGSRVEQVWYPSTVGGFEKRRMSIYLPEAYSSTSESFPVLYLLHGSGGDEKSWLELGRLKQIMDNMIAAGTIQPMIVAMPNGCVDLAATPGDDPANPDVQPKSDYSTSSYGQIEYSFIPEIVKYVEDNYRVKAGKANRAIAGLSLGGLHTLYTALNNPEEFDYIGLFSALTYSLSQDNKGGKTKIGEGWRSLKKTFPFMGKGKVDKKITALTGPSGDTHLEIYDDMQDKLVALKEAQPALVFIAIGKDDFLKKPNDDLRHEFDKKNFRYVYIESDGGHTWDNWRRYLINFLPRLFF